MKHIAKLSLAALALTVTSFAHAQTTLVIDSWRSDDAVWNEKIIPAFNKHYPNIKVEYRSPSDMDASKWNSNMEQRFEQGSSGDLIACRPFDGSQALFQRGLLKEVTEMEGMENFPSFALAPWQTDSGAQTFCLPMASVIHGFFYNKDIFKELGVNEPVTNADFYWALEKAKRAGYLPLAMGTKDKWEAATMGFQNIGPTYWKGEDGRDALLTGKERMDSKPYRQTLSELAKWSKYMGDDFEQRSYADSISAFANGKAAIYPAGSWDIMTFAGKIDMGVFPPPVEKKGDACYFSDHTDLGMGIYSKSKNPEAAELFLKWMTTAEFAELLTNEISGFFSLSNHFFDVKDPIAQEMISWRDQCDSTIRNSAQVLSRGEPNLELEIWETSVGVMAGQMSPAQAANQLQKGLESWYLPQRNSTKSVSNAACNCSPVIQ
ncbi:sugar ABC transporter substrate-binding protein [Enterovibrio norvegicus FF-162]|uniref:ABC transporter substrate-binding protein n=1 Tax=Enterovibrio norvegicus TaxID=188144 RepID=UPI0002F26490|nr:ABC transporter substrate-binding protein [Enterovibrio norvegicus]OEE90027.1 sugar ABC transporter substrate-binding protein [Enterovibrio norvegicus FF-162]